MNINVGEVIVAKFLHLYKERDWVVHKVSGKTLSPFTREVKPDLVYYVIELSAYEKWNNGVKGYTLESSALLIVDSNGVISKCIYGFEEIEFNEMERILYETGN